MPTATRPKRPGIGKRAIQPLTKLPEFQRLTDLSQLEKVSDAPVVVELIVGNTPIRFEGRRLKPEEERRVKALLDAAFPPELPTDPATGEARYDFRNLDYLAAKETNRRKARALTLYLAFPIFRDALPKTTGQPPTEDEILKFVESRSLDVSLLDYAQEQVSKEIAFVDTRRVGFTSGSNSPAS